MKTKALLVMAALAMAQIHALTIETPIANVYSLGTLTTDTGDESNFREGTFTFTSPIVGFKDYKITGSFNPDGIGALVLLDFFTTTKNFPHAGGDGVYVPETQFQSSGGLDIARDLTGIRFYIASGGGPNAAFINFPSTFALSQVETLPDPNPNNVPDTGSTSALLGIGALGLATIKRKVVG